MFLRDRKREGEREREMKKPLVIKNNLTVLVTKVRNSNNMFANFSCTTIKKNSTKHVFCSFHIFFFFVLALLRDAVVACSDKEEVQ